MRSGEFDSSIHFSLCFSGAVDSNDKIRFSNHGQ